MSAFWGAYDPLPARQALRLLARVRDRPGRVHRLDLPERSRREDHRMTERALLLCCGFAAVSLFSLAIAGRLIIEHTFS